MWKMNRSLIKTLDYILKQSSNSVVLKSVKDDTLLRWSRYYPIHLSGDLR